MSPLPTDPVDKNWPKGPNFKGIVIAFAVSIVIILVLAVFFLHLRGSHTMPVDTHSTPSQSFTPDPKLGIGVGAASGPFV